MIRLVNFAAAVVAASVSLASAQHSPAVDQRGTPQPTQNAFQRQDSDVLLNNLRQQPVYEEQQKAVGEIEDVVIGGNGQVRAVIIDVGRGSSPRLVALPMEALEFRQGPMAGATTRTIQVFLKNGRADIEKAPEFRVNLER